MTLNTKVSKIIKILSFFANFEKKFNLFEIFKKHKLIDAIILKINTLKQIYENIIKLQKHFANYQNKRKKNNILIEKKNILTRKIWNIKKK